MTDLEADLRRAKALLLERGWLPKCGSGAGAMCTLNAVGECTYGIGLGLEEQARRTEAVVQALRQAGKFTLDSEIAAWNDSQESISPVIELFNKAIENVNVA